MRYSFLVLSFNIKRFPCVLCGLMLNLGLPPVLTHEGHCYIFNLMKDLREKVAQLIMSRLDGSRIDMDDDYFNQMASLVDAGIGGFILFSGSSS